MTGTNRPNIQHTRFSVKHRVFARVYCSVSGMTPPTRRGGVGWCLVFVGGVSGGVTPGPIPNPEAKSTSADGTALGRVWESRSPPALIFLFVGRGCLTPSLCGLVAAARFLLYPQVNNIQ